MSKELNRIRARIALYRERMERARSYINAIEQNPSATVVRRKYAYVFAGNEKRDPMGAGVDIEVRGQVYGGSGKITQDDKGVHVELKILEPYALSVERRTSIRSDALRYAQGRVKFVGSKKSIL